MTAFIPSEDEECWMLKGNKSKPPSCEINFQKSTVALLSWAGHPYWTHSLFVEPAVPPNSVLYQAAQVTRPNERGLCQPELANALSSAFQYPEMLRLHPLCISPQMSSYQLSWWNVLLAHNSSFLSYSPYGLPHPLTLDWAIWRKWEVQVLSRSIICFCFLFCLPVLGQDHKLWLMTAQFACSTWTQTLVPKSRQAQPSLTKPSRATNHLTDRRWRNEGLLLQL